MEGFKFSQEALKYEQEKQERLLKEAKRGVFEMSNAESEELLDDMNEYRKGLEEAVREKKVELEKLTSRARKEQLKSEIAELEEQSASLSDFEEAGKDAEEFTVKT